MTGVLGDAKLEALLGRLHEQSKAQEPETPAYFQSRAAAGRTDFSFMDAGDHAHFADKLVALERDKAQFCYLTCRAIGARRVVELGTSFGVSTLYLAAAVRDNCRALGGGGVVIGTEHESAKAKAARANDRAGKRIGSGGSKVNVAICLRSRRAAPAMRSGQARQFAIGTRMSGGPSWATSDPSRYSTMPCTIDCGCTKMSIFSDAKPNK